MVKIGVYQAAMLLEVGVTAFRMERSAEGYCWEMGLRPVVVAFAFTCEYPPQLVHLGLIAPRENGLQDGLQGNNLQGHRVKAVTK
jgi:hypothetical protein